MRELLCESFWTKVCNQKCYILGLGWVGTRNTQVSGLTRYLIAPPTSTPTPDYGYNSPLRFPISVLLVIELCILW